MLVCTDSSFGDGTTTYGGYLNTEIEKISGAKCSKSYETDYVRLITYSEYCNLSPANRGTSTSYPNVLGITRLSTSSDYAEWLYSPTLKSWWTMTSYSGYNYTHYKNSYSVEINGTSGGSYAEYLLGVRPVITIKNNFLKFINLNFSFFLLTDKLKKC